VQNRYSPDLAECQDETLVESGMNLLRDQENITCIYGVLRSVQRAPADWFAQFRLHVPSGSRPLHSIWIGTSLQGING